MLKDITIGQYFPGDSIIHRLDSRFKIILTALYIIMIFSASSYTGMAIGAVYVIIAYMVSKISMIMIWKNLKHILPVLVVTAVMNVFFIDGEPLLEIGFITVTYEAVESAIFMILRIVLLIAGSSLLTYTTSPIALTDALERLMSPLKKIKVPVHELAMMMTIALRFIPTLIDETDRIMSAQKSRGADWETGKLMDRAKALLPIFIPLFVSAFRRAEELAVAMECRCYKGGEGRTRLKQLKSGANDYISLAVTIVFIAGVIVTNIYFGGKQ
ncbi:MAG: energy-coupling factor transporter transmembrane component T family protein [Oscillospiraceae bacterium]